MSSEFLIEARTSTREAFVKAHPHPFLVGVVQMSVNSATAQKTGRWDLNATVAGRLDPEDTGSGMSPTIRPIVKVQVTFPSMITVGRTRNNDIVLPDREISKFHAYFREVRGAFEVSDVGSSNGTKVRGELLIPKGPAVPIQSGDRINFGHLEFQFLDAEAAWTELRTR
jgi:pSer/pThr/pTyr-binding forkhead associated (FHA) protein